MSGKRGFATVEALLAAALVAAMAGVAWFCFVTASRQGAAVERRQDELQARCLLIEHLTHDAATAGSLEVVSREELRVGAVTYVVDRKTAGLRRDGQLLAAPFGVHFAPLDGGAAAVVLDGPHTLTLRPGAAPAPGILAAWASTQQERSPELP